MAPPPQLHHEEEQEEGEEHSSNGEYEEIEDPELEGPLEQIDPGAEAAGEGFEPEVAPAQVLIDPLGGVGNEEALVRAQLLRDEILREEQHLQVLKEERRAVENGFHIRQIEAMAEHKTAMGLVAILSREITSLENEKITLQTRRTEIEKSTSVADISLDDKLHQIEIYKIELEGQQTSLGRLKEEVRQREHVMRNPVGGQTTPGPQSHDHSRMSYESGGYVQEGQDHGNGRLPFRSMEERGQLDKDFIKQMKDQVEYAVNKRLSGTRSRETGYLNAGDVEEDQTSTVTTRRTGPRRDEKDLEPASRRHTMLPQEIAIFDENPTIAGLGLDIMAGRGGNAEHVKWTKERTKRLTLGPKPLISAKKQAIIPTPFTGAIPWKKWYIRFCEDMETNGWTESQILGSLKHCLRDGPGDDTLWAFEEQGDGSLDCLVTTAAWICGPIHASDPTVELEARRQRKGEGFRTFGLALRRLAKEAFEGLDPGAGWLVRKVGSLFIEGLLNEEMSKELGFRWQTEMSLNDLFTLAEDFERKMVLLKKREFMEMNLSASGNDVGNEIGELAAYTTSNPGRGQSSNQGRGRGGRTAGRGRGRGGQPPTDNQPHIAVGAEAIDQLRQMMLDVNGTNKEKETVPKTSKVPYKPKDKKDDNCFRCKKPGHWKRDCRVKLTTAALSEELAETTSSMDSVANEVTAAEN